LLCWVLGQFDADLDFDPDFAAEPEPDVTDAEDAENPTSFYDDALD